MNSLRTPCGAHVAEVVQDQHCPSKKVDRACNDDPVAGQVSYVVGRRPGMLGVTDEAGDRFERLYREHFRAVLRYSLARVDPERAKDATAETFLIAWRRLPDVPSEPGAWLFGVARKVIAGQLRGDARREALGTRLAIVRGEVVGPIDPADEVAERDAALTALDRLGAFDRELLRLVAWDGLSANVAARVLSLSQPAFAVRLHRARRRYADELAAADVCPSRQAQQRPLSHADTPVPLARTKEAR